MNRVNDPLIPAYVAKTRRGYNQLIAAFDAACGGGVGWFRRCVEQSKHALQRPSGFQPPKVQSLFHNGKMGSELKPYRYGPVSCRVGDWVANCIVPKTAVRKAGRMCGGDVAFQPELALPIDIEHDALGHASRDTGLNPPARSTTALEMERL